MSQKFESYDPCQMTSMYNLSEIDRQRMDEKLKKILRERGVLSEEQIEEALAHQAVTHLSLWRTLVNLGFLTPKESSDLLKAKPISIHPVTSTPFGVLLVENGFVTKQALREAKKSQQSNQKYIGQILIEQGELSEENLAKALAIQYGLAYVDLETKDTDESLIQEWPKEVMITNLILPLEKKVDKLIVATSDPFRINSFLEAHARLLLGITIEPCIASSKQIIKKLEKFFGAYERKDVIDRPLNAGEFTKNRGMVIKALAETVGPAKLTDLIIREGFSLGASDIHIEDMEEHTRIRFRIDDTLHEIIETDKKIGHSISTKLKVHSNMDIVEKRFPQDGHGILDVEGTKFEFRASSVPTCYGEKTVLRLFHKKKVISSFSQMGLETEQTELMTYFAKSPYGMFLTTGPVGSGKTTMLYAIINQIDILRKNVMTIEDPIEYHMAGVNQMQVSQNMSFSEGLRALLRQDPDVIMVGEIRDDITAKIAIRAALTGILVISTLHTSEACGAIITLKNFGVKDFLIASALLGVTNQRLVRKICPSCKEECKIDPALLTELGALPSDMVFYRGKGCSQCFGSGYRGMTGIYEMLFVDQDIKRLTMLESPVDTIKEAAIKAGMKTLRENGIRKIKAGITTVDELLRVC